MNEHELKCYLKAGETAAKALKEACRRVEEGVSVKEICEVAERVIKELGAQPAFPCNVSINHVAAHYTSPADDETVIPRGAVVKVDVGAHVDGYIGDVAATITLSPSWESLVEAARKALERALEGFKPGVALSRIGGVIESTIKSYGYKPVKNLTGHSLSRFNLHAGDSVPNVKAGEGVIEEGKAYAVEPFVTNGAGYVVDGEQVFIYRYSGGKVKDKGAKELLKEVWRRFNQLPFTERWLLDLHSLQKLRELLSELARAKAIYGYPVLVEGAGGVVSQFECTVVVYEGEALVTTPMEW